jgi:hypothetical protein
MLLTVLQVYELVSFRALDIKTIEFLKEQETARLGLGSMTRLQQQVASLLLHRAQLLRELEAEQAEGKVRPAGEPGCADRLGTLGPIGSRRDVGLR